MTFSLAARCARTGMLGVAVSTALPAVGSLCPFVAAKVGAVATQAWVNPYLGIDGLELLRSGHDASAALELLLAPDPGRDLRQLAVVDVQGGAVAFTGSDCTEWAGHLTGPGFAVQGNMLTGGNVLDAMAADFEQTTHQDLPERLVAALEAGQRVGGDKRGRQSAAVRVFWNEDYPYVDLRVDEHAQPVTELRRVWEVARRQLLPFITRMATRHNPLGRPDDEVSEFVQLSPEERAAKQKTPPA